MKALLVVIVICCAIPVFGQPMYTFTDLGTLGGTFSSASSINEIGQVSGTPRNSGGSLRAFRTQPGQPINPATNSLGVLGGNPPDTYGDNINDLGVVVGSGWAPGGFHGLFTLPNASIAPSSDMGTLGGHNSYANAVNNRGQIAGTSNLANSDFRAFRTSALRPLNSGDSLGTLGGAYSSAKDINDAGQVVGGSTGSGEVHAFRTAPDAAINPATDDLGTLGGTSSFAFGINEIAQVCGQAALPNGTQRAFRTAPGARINPLTDHIGSLGGGASLAADINDLGHAVGWSEIGAGSITHAFVSFSGTEMFNLNSLVAPGQMPNDWVLTRAWGINTGGWIVGEGTKPGFISKAFLLRPIPEPSSMLAGLIICQIARRRRRDRDR